jgi:cytochrome P450
VYLPFGAGPRACIGANLALLQMTLISLLVARRFRLVPVREESGSFRVQPRADYVP